MISYATAGLQSVIVKCTYTVGISDRMAVLYHFLFLTNQKKTFFVAVKLLWAERAYLDEFVAFCDITKT